MVFATPADPRKALAEAQALHKAGRLDEAAARYRAALAAAPTAAPILFSLAALESARGQRDAAIELLERAVKADPTQLKPLIGLGRLYEEAGYSEKALAAFEKAQKRAPNDGDLMMMRAISLGRLRRHDEAAALFRALAKAAPSAQAVWHNLGNTEMQRGDAPAAVQAFEKALALKPDDASSRYGLGRAQLFAGEHEKSLENLNAALEGAPHRVRALSYKIIALRHLGRHEEADDLEGLDDLIAEVRLERPPEYDTFEAFNDALRDEILNHPRLTDETGARAIRNGARLYHMFEKDPSPLFQIFERETRAAFERVLPDFPRKQGHPLALDLDPGGYAMDMWANVMRQGGHELPHNHDGWFSCCYYNVTPDAVDAPGDENQGWIEFGGVAYGVPAPAHAPTKRLKPEPGLMVVFPSYVFHRTIPFDSDEIRISTAFDTRPASWPASGAATLR